MSEVTTAIEIAAPSDVIWAIALDPLRLADWVTIHRKLHRHDTGPARVGLKMEQTLTLRGAPFKVHWRLQDCEPPRRALWHGDGPAGSRAETEYTLTPVAGGTRFDYRNEFHAPLGLLGRVAERAIAGNIPKSEAEKSLVRLKALCEAA